MFLIEAFWQLLIAIGLRLINVDLFQFLVEAR